MGPDFYQTMMGKRFYESQLPSLIKAVNRLADAIEESNRLNGGEKKEVIASADETDGCE